MATAELQAPASVELLIEDRPELKIFNPENEASTTTKEILWEVIRLIPELGVPNCGGLLFAIRETRHTNGSAELQFLSGAPDTDAWDTKYTKNLGAKPAEDLQSEIDKAIAAFHQSINWDATGI
ncbi:MAG TPA: hypothetical protein VHA78_04660 [Candidatus Peribacteraceae bacterium]|nr:hypothetical protein [Candidatus Peribacteraceae bacterium]